MMVRWTFPVADTVSILISFAAARAARSDSPNVTPEPYPKVTAELRRGVVAIGSRSRAYHAHVEPVGYQRAPSLMAVFPYASRERDRRARRRHRPLKPSTSRLTPGRSRSGASARRPGGAASSPRALRAAPDAPVVCIWQKRVI